MIRILFGPDVKDYAALEKELSETKAMLRASEEQRLAARHGWVGADARAEDLAQQADGLYEEIRHLRQQVEVMHRRWNEAVDQGFVPGEAPTAPVKVAGSLHGLGDAFKAES